LTTSNENNDGRLEKNDIPQHLRHLVHKLDHKPQPITTTATNDRRKHPNAPSDGSEWSSMDGSDEDINDGVEKKSSSKHTPVPIVIVDSDPGNVSLEPAVDPTQSDEEKDFEIANSVEQALSTKKQSDASQINQNSKVNELANASKKVDTKTNNVSSSNKEKKEKSNGNNDNKSNTKQATINSNSNNNEKQPVPINNNSNVAQKNVIPPSSKAQTNTTNQSQINNDKKIENDANKKPAKNGNETTNKANTNQTSVPTTSQQNNNPIKKQ